MPFRHLIVPIAHDHRFVRRRRTNLFLCSSRQIACAIGSAGADHKVRRPFGRRWTVPNAPYELRLAERSPFCKGTRLARHYPPPVRATHKAARSVERDHGRSDHSSSSFREAPPKPCPVCNRTKPPAAVLHASRMSNPTGERPASRDGSSQCAVRRQRLQWTKTVNPARSDELPIAGGLGRQNRQTQCFKHCHFGAKRGDKPQSHTTILPDPSSSLRCLRTGNQGDVTSNQGCKPFQSSS